VNQREKQTYYGAVNYLTKQFVLREYATANIVGGFAAGGTGSYQDHRR
jgi:hypothetical protein